VKIVAYTVKRKRVTTTRIYKKCSKRAPHTRVRDVPHR
jgi:hypothetical protein